MPAMRFKAALAVLAGAIALRLVITVGFANYDTQYSLVWGQQLARGQTPSYKLPLAPTPHPLLELLGVILAPLGASATVTIVVALAYLALASLGYLVYRLGASWFSWPVGLAAAALILSSLRGPQLRRSRLRRPPLRRARARGAGDRDAPAARRLAGDRAARPRRPAATRGVALRRRLLALSVARLERRRARAARRARRTRAGAMGALGPAGHRQPAVVADTPSRPRRRSNARPAWSTSPTTAPAGSARCSRRTASSRPRWAARSRSG